MKYHSFQWYSIGEMHIITGILLVHWYDWYNWYQWNIIHSNGIQLVKCISLLGL